MHKQFLLAIADYNTWANGIAIEWLQQISDEQWQQVISSSFPSVRQTAVHIASAEKVWIDFWHNVADPVYLSAGFEGSRQDLITIWENASAGLKRFIENCAEEDCQRPVVFKWPRGGEMQMEFSQTCVHVFNHSTYHRGQLVNALRQVGFTKLSSTDMATYYRVRQS
ncbi:DinB family protein [Chitinophaga pinensis]|nr:DinB family protein [Chitinophaga pinensis]